MFFVGSTQLTLTRDTGEFYCPRCAVKRTFKLKVVRQFLTVYFIPLIPLQVVKEFAECASCAHQHDPQTLSPDAEAYESRRRRQGLEVIRKAIVLIVASDDLVTDEELEVLEAFGRHFLQREFTADQILDEAEHFHESEVDPETWLRQAGKMLTDEEKQLLVHHAFLAASAGGDLSQARQGLLGKLPQALEMPEPLFRQMIERAANS
jgi:hypothetical protein